MLRLSKKNSIKIQKGFAKGFFSVLMLSSFFLVSQVSAADITSDGVIKLVNKARNEAGVPVLVKNSLLQKAAAEKAHDMFEQNYFAHVSPSGKTPWDFIEKAGYNYQLAGENLAINYTDIKEQQNAWMDSPLHRKNILNPAFSEIGVAVEVGVIDGHKTIITVQEFGTSIAKVAGTSDVAPIVIQSQKDSVDNVIGKTTSPTTISSVAKTAEFNLNNEMFNNFININEVPILGWIFAVIILILIVFIDFLAFINKRKQSTKTLLY